MFFGLSISQLYSTPFKPISNLRFTLGNMLKRKQVYGTHLRNLGSEQHSFKRRKIAAVASRWQHWVRFDLTKIWAADFRFRGELTRLLNKYALCLHFLLRPVGRTVSGRSGCLRPSLDRQVLGSILVRSNRTQSCQQFATSATLLWKKLCCPGAMTQTGKLGPW